jgi:hypothetical protein
MNYNIKELIIDGEGVFAISIVDDPAIELDFDFFNKDEFGRKGKRKPDGDLLRDVYGGYLWFRYENTVPGDGEIREFCRRREGNVYFIDEIKSWAELPQNHQNAAFIQDRYRTFLNTFRQIGNYNLDNAMYNCRHSLVAIKDPNDIPQYKKDRWAKTIRDRNAKAQAFSNETKLHLFDEDKKIIKGVAMVPNKMIYRHDVGNGQPGYIYFSKDTIKQIKENFGINHSVTFEHSYEITGSLTMTDSFITPDDKLYDAPEGSWIVEYKVNDNRLWDYIKKSGSLGFSIEAFLQPKY